MGVALALQLGVQPVLFALLGLLFYVVIYSMLLKRRTYWNIVLGSPAGAMPLLMGYSVAKPVDPTALYLAGLIILWTPPHIWALAMRLRDDYEAAGIPMLPLVLGERKSAKWIAVLSLILVGYTLLPIPLGYAGVLYAVMALLSSGLLCPVAMRLALSPNQRVAWQVFKASSPFLFLALTGVVFERMVGQGG
jgi:protoheme IX farnesyltransferase